MAGPLSHPKTTYVFSLNSPPSFFSSSSSSSSSSTLSSMKLKGTLVHARIHRALSRAKSIIIQFVKGLQLIQYVLPLKKNKKKNKLYLGSFRLHYNWCSSHIVPDLITDHVYYDSTWNSVVHAEYDDVAAESTSQLSGYLQWLEEKKGCGNSGASDRTNDIDTLADMFIADCYEKFRLEKQESNRRFQEMMARSV